MIRQDDTVGLVFDMKLFLCTVSMLLPFVHLFSMTNTRSFASVTDLPLPNTSDRIRLSTDGYSPSTSNAGQQVASGVMLIKCPIVMCAPHHDAVSALEVITDSRLNMTNISDGTIVVFGHKLGPFSSATVSMFNPPNPYLNHFANVYGQMESIISTALVQCVSLDLCIKEMEYVKSMFESKLDNVIFEKQLKSDEIIFMTRSSTSFGWYILLSAKKIGADSFLQMNIFRKRHLKKKKDDQPLIECDI